MEKYIEEYLCEHEYFYQKLSLESIEKVYELFHDRKIFIPSNDIERVYLGLWYQLNGDYDHMKEFYTEPMNNGRTLVMLNLAGYYLKINDEDRAISHWSMAKENGDIRGIFALAKYYKSIGNIEMTIKCYEEAIDLNSSASAHCMVDLSSIYSLENDEENMKKICYHELEPWEN